MKMDGLCISEEVALLAPLWSWRMPDFMLCTDLFRRNAAHDAPHILVVNSYHQGFKWTDELTETVTGDLMKTFPDAEMHVVYLDRKRQLSQNYLHLIREQLQYWYPQNRPDVVITSDDAALSFVKQWSDQLFPQVPVVFLRL